jgi:hypothetical protein
MANKEVGAVAVHQLVYGSAAKLLATGASDLGVIASTRGFPQEATRRLNTHRAYANEDKTGAVRPVKYIAGTLGRYVELTRVEMGVDHTGRSLPFTHHVLIEDATLRKAGMSVGDFIRQAAAICRSPREFSAGYIEPQGTLSGGLEPASASLGAEAIAVMAAAVIRYPVDKRPVVLVSPRPTSTDAASDPFLPVIAAIADVLPAAGLAALVAATHVIGKDDRLAEASIVCTYPDTPFFKEMSSRSGSRTPVIVDLATGRASVVADGTDAFTRATIADLKAGAPGRFPRLCDHFGATPEQFPIVAELAQAVSRLTDKPALANLEALSAAVEKGKPLANRPRLLEWAEREMTGIVSQQWATLSKDVAGQQGGAARLAKAVVFSDDLLEMVGRVGAKYEAAGRKSEADVAAAALLTLGARGKTIGRQAGDREKNQDFATRFIDKPRETTPIDSGPAIPVQLPGPRGRFATGAGPRPRGADGGTPGVLASRDGSWRTSGESASGGMLIPWLALLVAVGACAIPVAKAYLYQQGKAAFTDPTGVMADIGRALHAVWSGRLGECVVPGVLLAVVIGMIAAYRLLSDWFVSRLGSLGSLIPTIVLVMVSLSSFGLAVYPPGARPDKAGEAEKADSSEHKKPSSGVVPTPAAGAGTP